MFDSTWVVAVVAVLLASVLAYRLLFQAPAAPVPASVGEEAKLKVFTEADVRKHASDDDCWLIIKSKVYDVTPYVQEHPGGRAILRNAGGEATEGFFGPQHPPRVFDLIDDFLIGTLEPTHS